jgi:hypothetical protein
LVAAIPQWSGYPEQVRENAPYVQTTEELRAGTASPPAGRFSATLCGGADPDGVEVRDPHRVPIEEAISWARSRAKQMLVLISDQAGGSAWFPAGDIPAPAGFADHRVRALESDPAVVELLGAGPVAPPYLPDKILDRLTAGGENVWARIAEPPIARAWGTAIRRGKGRDRVSPAETSGKEPQNPVNDAYPLNGAGRREIPATGQIVEQLSPRFTRERSLVQAQPCPFSGASLLRGFCVDVVGCA